MAATGQSELGPRSSAEPAQAAGSPAAGGAHVLMWAGQGPALEAHASVNTVTQGWRQSPKSLPRSGRRERLSTGGQSAACLVSGWRGVGMGQEWGQRQLLWGTRPAPGPSAPSARGRQSSPGPPSSSSRPPGWGRENGRSAKLRHVGQRAGPREVTDEQKIVCNEEDGAHSPAPGWSDAPRRSLAAAPGSRGRGGARLLPALGPSARLASGSRDRRADPSEGPAGARSVGRSDAARRGGGAH